MTIIKYSIPITKRYILKQLTYTSTGQNPFDAWRIALVSWPIGIFVSLLFTGEFSLINLIFGILIALIIPIMISIIRITEVTRIGDQVICQGYRNHTRIDKVVAVESWWSYSIAVGTTHSTEGLGQKATPPSNVMYIYLVINGVSNTVVLYEKIQMSSKFPNNHPYLDKTPEAVLPKYKIWDVDNCFKKLELEEFKIK